MNQRRLLILAVMVALASPAAAQEAGPTTDPLDLQIHGFASQGFLVTTDNNYLAESKHGSFEFAEAGINFTKPLSDELRVGVQLFARDLGPVGNYNAKFDWFYLDYRFRDWLGIRAGRVKLPFGLYNEINDIDAARVPILLPEAVYPAQNRDFLLAQTGVEVYGLLDLGMAGRLDYRLYGGTMYFEVQPQRDTSITDLKVPYLIGGRLFWETPLPGLRAGVSAQALRLKGQIHFEGAVLDALRTRYSLAADFNGDIALEIPVLLWVGSLEYSAGELLLAAEYSHWRRDMETRPSLSDLENVVVSERGYLLGAYRLNAWLQPGIYYSVWFPDFEHRRGRAAQQHDLAATLRFDLDAHWLVKVEGHYLHGTATLNPNLNDGVPREQLEPDWGLLLVKTTAYF